MKAVDLNEKELASKDAVLIATDHTSYDYEWILKHSAMVIDTRNACRPPKADPNLIRA